MKKSLLYIAAAVLSATALSACDDDFAYPPIVEPESEWAGKENTTIAELKAEYWQNAGNYNTSVGVREDGSEIIVKGRVISSDATGNIYNNIVIMDETGAMTIASRTKNSSTKLSAQYPYGTEVYLNLSGCYVGRYAGLFQMGQASGTEISFLDNETLLEHMQANSLARPELIDTMTVDIATLTAAKADVEKMQYYMSRLVRIDGVTFRNAGEPFAESQTENRYVQDADGASINVRCSNRSTWNKVIIPSGSGSIVGILSYFNNDWQILMNDAEGCVDFNSTDTPRFTPAGGTVTVGTEISISCSTEGAAIHYTTDGTEPTASSPVYNAPIVAKDNFTLKAFAVAEGKRPSPVVTADYIVAEEIKSNISIADFKAMFWSDDRNSATLVENNEAGEPYVIMGRVVSSDYTGNIYKAVYIEDGTAGITLAVNATKLYEDVPLGQQVAFTATGIYAGMYNNLLQLGGLGEYNGAPSMTFMSKADFDSRFTLVGAPEPDAVKPAVVTIAELNDAKATAAGKQKWMSRLVKIEGVSFTEGGAFAPNKTNTNRTVKDASGNTIIVRNSGYATFANETMPTGTGSVTGVLSFYGSDWQILLIDAAGCADFK